MTKKWLMYVVTGILCCGMIGFAVAKQTGRNKQMTERDRAKMELLQVEQSMLKYGETPELAAKKAELNVKLGLEKSKANGMSTGSAVLQTPQESATVAKQEETADSRRDALKLEAESLLDAITSLEQQNRDFTAQKIRLSEVLEMLNDGREVEERLDQGGETCALATVITSLPYCDPGTTAGAVNNYGCTANPQYGPDVVYSYTPTVNETVTVSLCGGSTWDTRIIVSQGCPDAGGVNVLCNDDFCGLQSCGTVTMTAGLTYFIIVDAFSTGSGAYVLKLTTDGVCSQAATCPGAIGRCCYNNGNSCADNTEPDCQTLGGTWTAGLTCAANPCPILLPGGETCANRVALTVGQSWSSSTLDNAPETGIPNCGSFYNTSSNGEWYSVIGNGNTLTLSLCNLPNTFDTEIFVFCGSCDVLACIGGNDDFCGLTSQFSWCSALGQEYFILMTGFSGAGDYGAALLDGAPCADPLPCEIVVGRCCYNDGLCCAENLAIDCASLGGTWTEGATCADPCTQSCVITAGPFDIEEDAESDTCGFELVDPNGGCNNTTPTFTQLACGDTLAGISYYYCDGGGFPQFRDTDWGEFTITDTMNVRVTAVCEAAGYISGLLLSPCPQTNFFALGFDAGCGTEAVAEALCLPPGTYYTWFGLIGNSCTSFDQPAHYRQWIECSPCVPPTGRCCYDGGLSCINTTFGECELLGGVWDEFLTCETDPCAIQPPNDDCGTALEIVVVPNGTATANVANEGATNSCTGTCTDDCGTWVSTSPDQFFYFTLTECRLIAVMADPNDPHIEVYEDGQCCGTPILCNDDWGCNPDLDFYAWLPPALRPTANFGSMVADTLPAGTYYIRAGEWGAGWNGDYVLSVIDFGPCEIAPCDPIVDLAIYAATVGSIADHIELFFTAPQDDDYKVWSTANPNNDGNPNDGADPDWTLVATLPGLLAGPQTWVAPAGFSNYLNYVVTAVCEPFQAPVGRCCYGDFQCADITEAECNDLGGFWTQFANCANDPCPPPPPANDDCGNAIEVFNGVPLAGTTDGAFVGADITTCTFSDVYDVWYVYNAPNTNPITATTCEATFYYDTGISAWSACGGTELACNDDNCVTNGLQSTITFSPSAAGPVYIRVSGYSSQFGTFTLSVTQ